MTVRISHRQSTYWDFSEAGETTRVHFSHKEEHSFVAVECDEFHIASDHPVLLDYREEWRSVYLASTASQPEATRENISAEITGIVGAWRPSMHYFNDQVDPLELLRGGSGLLVEAPKSIADRACAALERDGVSYTVLSSRPSRPPMRALIAGPNFVVARDFRTEQTPASADGVA